MTAALPFNPSDISIEHGVVLDPLDSIYKFSIPSDCVQSAGDWVESQDDSGGGVSLESLLIQICVTEAVARFGIEPLWGPVILPESKSDLNDVGADYCFSVMLDDTPLPEWPDFSRLSLSEPDVDVDEEMIETELGEQLLNAGTTAPSGEPLAEADEADGHVILSLVETGEVLLDMEEATVRVPAAGVDARIGEIVIDGLAEALVGGTAGDSIQITSSVPESINMPGYSGKPMSCRFDVKESFRGCRGSIEDVCAYYGCNDETTLRQQIGRSLEHRLGRQHGLRLFQEIYDQISRVVDMPVPQRVLKQLMAKRRQAVAEQLKQSGVQEGEVPERLESQKETHLQQVREQSLRHSMTLLLHREFFEFRVGNEQIMQQVEILARLRGEPASETLGELEAAGLMTQIYLQCIQLGLVERISGIAGKTTPGGLREQVSPDQEDGGSQGSPGT